MRILSIDTALNATSAAVYDAAADLELARETAPMERGHAEALIPLIDRVAQAAGGLSSIDRLAVTTGPGSFTGIRVGLSAARALSLALKRPLVGVTTLAAMAAPFLAEEDAAPVAVAIDARHGRVYFQMFGPGARSLVPARVLPLKEAARSAGTGRVRIAGNGAGLVAEAGDAASFEILPVTAPDPGWIARLGAVSEVPARPPRPLYLRPADAKPQEGQRIARLPE